MFGGDGRQFSRLGEERRVLKTIFLVAKPSNAVAVLDQF